VRARCVGCGQCPPGALTMQLVGVDAFLGPLLAQLAPVVPVRCSVQNATGGWLATDLAAPASSPAAAVALRAGLAVRALDLVGASPQSPVALPYRPELVSAGAELPPGCDAVIDPAAITQSGPLTEAMESVEPGAHVRLAGHDLQRQQLIRTAGSWISAELILAARLAGIDTVEVRRAGCAFAWPAGPQADWLMASVRSTGAQVTGDAAAAHVVIAPNDDDRPRLALRPGETGWANLQDQGPIEIKLPKRFDGMIGGWCAFVLPLLARLMDAEIARQPMRLTRKLVSTVGISEIALLRCDGDQAHPLAIGELTLAAIAGADAYALLAPGAEGAATGDPIHVTSLRFPFRSRTTR
jgi:molybdopterin molybdotransferase